MRIAFRADASIELATGHVMRCLTLADAWRERGASSLFLCRGTPGHLMDRIAQRGHQPVALPEPPAPMPWDWRADAQASCQVLAGQGIDWLVVDHYALDRAWQACVRPHCRHLMVIDDLADRSHDCDLLLDPNLGRRAEDYDGLLPAPAARLLGPAHALLRPAFAQWRAPSLARRADGPPKHLLVAMGGLDPANVTGQVLRGLQAAPLPPALRISVVMGAQSPGLAEVRQLAACLPCRTDVLVDSSDIAALMAGCDLALGAAGGMAWERCCLGLPSLLLAIAPNQQFGAQALANHGAALLLDSPAALVHATLMLLAARTTATMQTMSRAAAALVDGAGAERVIRAMEARHG